MGFNADKCKVTRIINKKRPLYSDYTIQNQKLNIKTEAKYLGVTISSDLSWSRHADNVAKKANSTMRFLKRNIRSAPQAAKATAYKMFVLPIGEYAATTWALTPAQTPIRLRWSNEEQPDLLQMTAAKKQCHRNDSRPWLGHPSKA